MGVYADFDLGSVVDEYDYDDSFMLPDDSSSSSSLVFNGISL